MESFVGNDPWPSPPILSDLNDQMDSLAELQEGGFEPQIRARSNTWPLPRPENFVDNNEDAENNQQSNQQSVTGMSFLFIIPCKNEISRKYNLDHTRDTYKIIM
jgi:hypothetical protein